MTAVRLHAHCLMCRVSRPMPIVTQKQVHEATLEGDLRMVSHLGNPSKCLHLFTSLNQHPGLSAAAAAANGCDPHLHILTYMNLATFKGDMGGTSSARAWKCASRQRQLQWRASCSCML